MGKTDVSALGQFCGVGVVGLADHRRLSIGSPLWMMKLTNRTRWARGLALLVLLVWGLCTPPAPPRPDRPLAAGGDDLTLFAAVAKRIGQGDAYYHAMGDELTRRQYPTSRVANWRTPVHLTLLGRAPRLMPVVVALIGALVMLGTASAFPTVGHKAWLIALFLQMGVVAALWKPVLLTLPEPLAGALIALSVLVGLRGWRATSIGLGLAALLIRELAAPYVGVRLLLALYRRQWREARGWSVGIAAYAVFFWWHMGQVHAAMPATSVPAADWITGGGLRFVLATVGMNAWLMATPWWIGPFALVLALLGATQTPLEVRLPIGVYFAVFAIVGLPFNAYWGFVPAMLLPLAWMHVGAAARAHTALVHDIKWSLKQTTENLVAREH